MTRAKIAPMSERRDATQPVFKLGVIVNPYAGVGGAVGLKGSDGAQTREQALSAGAQLRAPERMVRALARLQPLAGQFELYGFDGPMGADVAHALGYPFYSVGAPVRAVSEPDDTLRAARALQEADVDLIVFAGGDGTARNLADALELSVPVLGVPAGVKIHSGVYAINPEAASDILQRMVARQWVALHEAEVRDIDETAFRDGRVRARHYSELMVPESPQWLQQVKNAGAQVDELAQMDVAADMIERLQEDTLYIVGPGSTTRVFLDELGLEGTLLGVDILLDNELIGRDLSERELTEVIDCHSGCVALIITAIGGQGHIFGRGNQQLSPTIIRAVGRDNLFILATTEKLQALEGRPLLVDTDDPALDRELGGFLPVITGYHQQVLYPVGSNVGRLRSDV